MTSVTSQDPDEGINYSHVPIVRIQTVSADAMEIRSDTVLSRAHISHDGRFDLTIQHKKNLGHVLRAALHHQQKLSEPGIVRTPSSLAQYQNVPRMNIVIQIIGSRGDVQPFVALAQVLIKDPYNHRVRFCTHPVFKEFIEESGLEFFSIGGDPAVLMAYMVKNPGLIPGIQSLKGGDVGKRRKDIALNLESAWRSCIESYDSSEEGAEKAKSKRFIADAIIANPPSFAHLHCAEKLGIPLHLMFTMPWSPTQSFPHPLANIKATNIDKPISNYLSYSLVELMTWQGLGDVINNFRIRTLSLEPISVLWAGGLISRLEVPYTYCWSTALIPKPKDWGSHIGISGFYFLGLASNYKPPQDLIDFLEAGPPPVYIGFGSIVVDNPDKLTELIFEAVKKAGVRAIVSKGWGGIGGVDPPEGILLLGNCPHDWLFPKMAAVVHHGGAGTTAIGVACGKPTVVVPFFGDQSFWGAMIARAGAGPDPVPFKQMTAESLTNSIEFSLRRKTVEAAKEMAEQIRHEDGKVAGAEQFHDALNLDHMRCSVHPSHLAVWRHKPTRMKLSAFAATTMAKEGKLKMDDLEILRHKEWIIDQGPQGPVSGSLAAVVGTLTNVMLGIGHLSVSIAKASAYELSFHHHQAYQHFHNMKEKKSLPKVSTDGSKSVDDLTIADTSPHTETNIPEIHDGSSLSDPHPPQNVPSEYTFQESRTGDFKTAKSKSRWEKAQKHSPSHLYSRKSVSHAFPGFLSQRGNPYTSMILERKHRAKLRRENELAKHGSNSNTNGTLDENGKRRNVDSKGMAMARDIVATAGFTLATVVKIPMELTYNIAIGCHNAPIIWCNDDTVRKPTRIIGIPSGFVAAGKEFTLGWYDGITGLVTQPYNGARKDGAKGFAAGIGKGLGGLFFKGSAAIWGIPGYPLKGLQQELRKLRHSGTLRYIRTSRVLQGLQEWEEASEEERNKVIERWGIMKKRGWRHFGQGE